MKRISVIAASAAAFCLGGVADLPLGGSEARAAELISVNDAGTDSGNGHSIGAVTSADGTKVAFYSLASNFGPTDTKGLYDVYVRDLTTGKTILVSVNDSGTDSGKGASTRPAISADGKKVVFYSDAYNLGPTDTNGVGDVYVRDLNLEKTFLVSINGLGTDSGNESSAESSFTDAAINADGTRVAFTSLASDLGPTDTNGLRDVYHRDLVTGTTSLVSINSVQTDSGNHISAGPVISADGNMVAFTSIASNFGPIDTNGIHDVYVRYMKKEFTGLVSVNSFGTDSGNRHSNTPVISAGGIKVAFLSTASDLGPNDTNGIGDIYVRDINTGTTTLVSVNGLGTDGGNDVSTDPVFSADGTRIAFRSRAGNLGSTDTNGTQDVYFRDLVTGTTTLVSVNEFGTDSGSAASSHPIVGANGTMVAFGSVAKDLVPADTNGIGNVYVRDVLAGTTKLVSVNDMGIDGGNGNSGPSAMSADGTLLFFRSDASDLGPVDTNAVADVYLAKIVIPCSPTHKVPGCNTNATFDKAK